MMAIARQEFQRQFERQMEVFYRPEERRKWKK
jgi:hypothetical protein